MGIQPDSSPFGSQTVTGPGWPNVNEEQLEEAAAHYTKLATKISGSVVPQQTSQLMNLSLIHISEPTRRLRGSRMPSSA